MFWYLFKKLVLLTFTLNFVLYFTYISTEDYYSKETLFFITNFSNLA